MRLEEGALPHAAGKGALLLAIGGVDAPPYAVEPPNMLVLRGSGIPTQSVTETGHNSLFTFIRFSRRRPL